MISRLFIGGTPTTWYQQMKRQAIMIRSQSETFISIMDNGYLSIGVSLICVTLLNKKIFQSADMFHLQKVGRFSLTKVKEVD